MQYLNEPMNKDQKFGMTEKKEVNFSEWYSQVLLKGEMHDYYDIKGCYILRPQSMFLWNRIQDFFNAEIRKLGVEECYFPMLITKNALEKEKSHIENFAPELAWITKCGETPLEVPVAVRPTSETIMYPSYAKWIRSHRDLPLKLNQWCNVLRWEVKSTLPFIRGREFLWQEGHSAFLTRAEAELEVKTILDLYQQIYKDLLAVPVIPGVKSENEKFGGAEYSLSVEAFIPDVGKGIQAATSHFLGTNFSKMFDIQVENISSEDKSAGQYVYQNSWGFTTRSIGIAVMLHSDNKGLVLPPRIAKTQVVIVPCGINSKTTEENKTILIAHVNKICGNINDAGIRAVVDSRDNVSPGYKYNFWEIQGVPIRLEVGFRDLAKSEVTLARRCTGAKRTITDNDIGNLMVNEINTIHMEMYQCAEEKLQNSIVFSTNFEEFYESLNLKKLLKVNWCTSIKCEENIKEKSIQVAEDGTTTQSGAKSMCIVSKLSLDTSEKCFNCSEQAKGVAIFGRTY